MATEARDSLRSRAVLSILDLLGEGEIGGLVDGLKSVYLNETPIQNANGTYNFKGVTADSRTGSNSQSVMSGFGNFTETPYEANVQVKQATPYTFTISNPETDKVRVIVSTPGLLATNSDTGDTYGAAIEYKFSMSVNGGAYTDVNAAYVWVSAGTWAIEGGHLTATKPVSAIEFEAQVRPVVTSFASGSNYCTGTVTVQPQQFDGTSWTNLGSAQVVPISYSYVSSDYGAGSYEYSTRGTVTVRSSKEKVRFIVVSTNVTSTAGDKYNYYPSGTLGITQTSFQSLVPTPTITMSGKTRSKYQRAHVLSVPAGASTVSFRVTRISADSSSIYLNNDLYVDAYNEIVSMNLSYPNSAIFGLRIDSEQFSSVPTRAYLVKGLRVRVPSNYNADTRVYSGVWNGTFQYAVTDNPAWILFDVLTNTRYGLGNYISETQIDKAALYTIGKYCDELVPNGFGGTEPRFTINTVIAGQAEAYKLVTDITSALRGMAYWDGGMVNFTQDSPSDATMLYGPANVIDGQFNYTGSARKDRHSVVHVTWNDPEDFYRQKIEYVEDAELITQYGIRKLDTLAFGCTSRGQAARVGRWILYTEKYESDFITFKVGIDSAFVRPGNIIKIQDPNRAGKRLAGRLKSCSSSFAELDSEVTLATVPATISIMMPDGTFVDRQLVQAPGTYNTVSWGTGLSTMPVDGAMWMITEPNLVPVTARVLSVAQSQKPGEFEITSLEHNSTKYGAIENGLTLVERPTSIISPDFVQTPKLLKVGEETYLSAPGVTAIRLLITWQGDSHTYDLEYRHTYNGLTSNWVKTRVSDNLSFELDSVKKGSIYEVRVTGINPLGKRSETVGETYTVLGKTKPPSNVGTMYAEVTDQGVKLDWIGITDPDVRTYEVRKSGTPGQAWTGATLVVKTPTLTYLIPPFAPAGTHEWQVKAIDTSDNYSAVEARVSAVIQAPSTPVLSTEFQQQNAVLSWDSAKTSFPIKEYEIRHGASFATGTRVAIVTAETYVVAANWLGSRTFWVQAKDIAGNVSTAGSIAVTPIAPSAVTPTYAYKSTNMTLTWAASTPGSLTLAGYLVRQGANWATATAVGQTTDTSYTVRVNWTTAQTFWVAPIDSAGNVGTPTSVAVPFSLPGTPSVTSTISGSNLVLTWTKPSSTLDLASYEVRFGSSFAGGTSVGVISGNTLTVPVGWLGSRTFWVAASDLNGNTGTAGSHVSTITVPATPTGFGVNYTQGQATLFWASARTSLPIDYYEVRRGSSWETGSVVGKAYTNTLTLEVSWTTSATFWVKAYDVNGNASASEGSYIAAVSGPGAVSVAHQFKDTNLILSWAAPSTGSLPIKHYEVREGATWNTGTVIGTTSDRSYSIPVNWTSGKTFWVAAVDTANNVGTAGSTTTSYATYGAVPGLTATVSQAVVTLTWQAASGGSLPISYYDIRHGGVWSSGEIIGKANTTTITIPVTWTGSRTIWVTAVDSNGQFGTSASVAVSITVPSAPSVSAAIVVAKAELTWSAPSASLPIKEYEIRYGASFAAGTLVATTLSTAYRAAIDWTGSRTFWIAARDVNNNLGTAGSAALNVTAPAAPTMDGSFVQDQFKLTWTEPTASLPIEEYEVRHGATWAGGTVLGRVKGTTISTKAEWAGSRTWWVAAIDVNGNVGAQASKAFSITAPSAPNVTAQVVDNNVLLYWTQSTGTLPIATYEVRKGATWATATSVGQKSGGFTSLFESASGVYTYLVAAIDTAGNIGPAGAVSTTVSQPPDYLLRADDDIINVGVVTPLGVFSNVATDVDGSYVMPVNTTETQAQHFTTRSWSTPQDQVNAGFPVFIQPALSPGYYEEEIDYGTVLGGTKITVTPTGSVISGTPNVSIDISVKMNSGDAWTTYTNVTSVFVAQFRYAKIKFNVTGDQTSLYRLTKLNVKLDVKLRNEAGMGSASATDSVSGTTATVNGVSTPNPLNSAGVRVPDGAGTMVRPEQTFIDITGIEISVAAGSSARYGLFDFTDVANPAGFKVLLYDASGNRVGGNFSWAVKGY